MTLERSISLRVLASIGNWKQRLRSRFWISMDEIWCKSDLCWLPVGAFCLLVLYVCRLTVLQ